jgi:hypothetical protein
MSIWCHHQGVAAESAVGALRKNAKQIVAPVFDAGNPTDLGDSLRMGTTHFLGYRGKEYM